MNTPSPALDYASVDTSCADLRRDLMDLAYIGSYFKVQWTDAEGKTQLSAPIAKWTDAEMYRREIGGDAVLLRY